MIDFVIDIETLGTSSDAAVISVAVVSSVDGEFGEYQYQTIDLDEVRGSIDGSTIKWWGSVGLKSEAWNLTTSLSHIINAGLDHDNINKCFINVTESSAIENLNFFIKNQLIINDQHDFRVWGNGPDFDCKILENLAIRNSLQHKIPWKYYQLRDIRTLDDIRRVCFEDFNKTTQITKIHQRFPSVPIVKHFALSDALFEACLVNRFRNFLNKKERENGLHE